MSTTDFTDFDAMYRTLTELSGSKRRHVLSCYHPDSLFDVLCRAQGDHDGVYDDVLSAAAVHHIRLLPHDPARDPDTDPDHARQWNKLVEDLTRRRTELAAAGLADPDPEPDRHSPCQTCADPGAHSARDQAAAAMRDWLDRNVGDVNHVFLDRAEMTRLVASGASSDQITAWLQEQINTKARRDDQLAELEQTLNTDKEN